MLQIYSNILEVYHMDQIAFFWVGSNIEIPSFLVKSINHAYDKKNVKIYLIQIV